jgi:hypothetical protein
MTYVIGIRRFDTTAILVDSAISTYDAAARNFRTDPDALAVKNGVLYPGCIYGLAGNPEPAHQFVQKMRSVVATEAGLQEKWEALEAAVRIYPFPAAKFQQFELIISSRHSGVPELFVVDSETETLRRVHDDIYTLGSGKDFLDVQQVLPFAGTMLTPDRIIQMERPDNAFKRLDYPYMLAFLVHMSTCGEHGRQLYQAGVGGVVHFIRQDSRSEERQKPSLYVLAFEDPATRARTLYRRRIAVEHHARIPQVLIVFDKHYDERGEWQVFGHTDSDETDIPRDEADSICREILERHRQGAPYYFMAAGVIDWQRYCQPFFFLVDIPEGRRPWADLTDYLDPFVEDQLNGYMQAPPDEEIARLRAEREK